MESSGIPSKIHVSESAKTLALKTNPSFVFKDRGNVQIKVSQFNKSPNSLT